MRAVTSLYSLPRRKLSRRVISAAAWFVRGERGARGAGSAAGLAWGSAGAAPGVPRSWLWLQVTGEVRQRVDGVPR